MTLAFSTSSPLVSVALFDASHRLIGAHQLVSNGAASATLGKLINLLLSDNAVGLDGVLALAVDLGPGGFTGTRVGVTFAKTLAWSRSLGVFTATSFDLIDAEQTVAIASRKGEWYVREPGGWPHIVKSAEFPGETGYGRETSHTSYPEAARFDRLLPRLAQVDPLQVAPQYVAEPSISQPKKPYRETVP
ncbi:MAG: tRNA (adenosine(37)-N6)-threonylcarbamoyltransferase complex dimerization subunit type 1 TsaB [Armatimonadetes bacterium]|nr:tRNA (adenosine(37)-N6)-threonylcarbamoyltransferase complex dimerization subunit type 1 TsaB [Armatimonadota bacterium]